MHASVEVFPGPLMLVLFCSPENAAVVWFVTTVSYVKVSSGLSGQLQGLIINISGH